MSLFQNPVSSTHYLLNPWNNGNYLIFRDKPLKEGMVQFVSAFTLSIFLDDLKHRRHTEPSQRKKWKNAFFWCRFFAGNPLFLLIFGHRYIVYTRFVHSDENTPKVAWVPLNCYELFCEFSQRQLVSTPFAIINCMLLAVLIASTNS